MRLLRSDRSDASDWSDPGMVLLALLLVLACSSAYAAPSIEWQRGPEMPSARDHLGCGVIDGLFVVAGGAYWEHEAKHYGRGTIAYSPTQGRWITLPDLPMPGAYGASAVIDNQLLIAGGADSTGALKRCFRLRRVDGRLRWESLPDLPRPIWGASGAAVGSRFYVVGGASDLDLAKLTRAERTPPGPPLSRGGAERQTLVPPLDKGGLGGGLFMLDLSSPVPRWTEFVGPGMPSGRVGAATAVVGSKLYVFGGYGLQADGTLGNFGDAFVLDTAPKIRAWKRIKPMPVATRWSAAEAIPPAGRPTGLTGRTGQTGQTLSEPRYLVIAGGYAENPVKGFLDKVWLYDTANDEYLPCDPLPLAACTMASGVGPDGTVYLAGGEDAMRHRTAAFVIGRTKQQ